MAKDMAPIITLKEIILFPGAVIHFDVDKNRKSENKSAVVNALKGENRVVVMFSDESEEAQEIAVLADINQFIKPMYSNIRVVIRGITRVRITGEKYSDDGNYRLAEYEIVENEKKYLRHDHDALIRNLREMLVVYMSLDMNINPNIFTAIKTMHAADEAVDYVASRLDMPFETGKKIINECALVGRFEILASYIVDEIRTLKMKNELHDRVQEIMEDRQREYYLREQLQLIRQELDGEEAEDADDFMNRCLRLNASDEVKEHIKKEIRRYNDIVPASPEAGVSRTYIETLLSLPWYNKGVDNSNITNIEKVLNKNHYGLNKVKERIIESLAVRQLNGNSDAPILCLVGPPGTGKTSIARAVADALGKKYVRICLGGMGDEAEIRGHRRTYVGAMPGRIINALKNSGVSNPLILLDEIDKVGYNNVRGDAYSALLEVLDPEQNTFFTDHYVEIAVDLSDVLFICTANSTQNIPEPLLDRMEIINISGYTENEKFHIAKKHLLSKQRTKCGLKSSELSISDTALRTIISSYTRESGVRNLERSIGRICRKAAKKIVAGENGSVRITGKNLHDYLGRQPFIINEVAKKDEIGIVRGLAWTSFGGDTLEIEVNIMPGKGKCELTGQLGDIMKESAKAAISYVRSQSGCYSIADDFFEKNDIHIHIPEGAVPKDGPSAGITMATAIFSAVTERKVIADVAMTGEITLRGRVLPVGGLKEKLLAAKRAGVHTVLVPEDNRNDISEIEAEITEGLDIRYVNNMEQVIAHAVRCGGTK